MQNVTEIKRKGSPEAAEYLRGFADMIEAGDIKDWTFVARSIDDDQIHSTGGFENRLLLLGAIEFAKQAIHDLS